VLTNGCFDLLHVGHVRYLYAARLFGDKLAVGLNSDRSVRLIKGEGRPIITQSRRAEVLSALEMVDYVTVFSQLTAASLIEKVQPAVYVKGGVYSSDPAHPNFPPEGNVVEAYGGSIRIVGYEPGHSTTGLLSHLLTGR